MFSMVPYPLFETTRKNPQRKKKSDREVLLELNYRGFEFLGSAKYYGKIEWQKIININVFGYKNKQFYAMYVSKQHNEDVLNLLRITKDENQHYVLIKDFNNMMFNNTKHKERK